MTLNILVKVSKMVMFTYQVIVLAIFILPVKGRLGRRSASALMCEHPGRPLMMEK